MGKYASLAVGLIDEGRFEKEIDDAVQKSAKGLLDYQKRHGKDKTRGAKSVVTVKITIAADKKSEAFIVVGEIRESIPSRPPVVNMAIEEADQDGTDTLFMRKSGGTKDTPQQKVLSTMDGETVDPKTGEVVSRKSRAAGE